jgi:ABC-2 type transport system permease protein
VKGFPVVFLHIVGTMSFYFIEVHVMKQIWLLTKVQLRILFDMNLKSKKKASKSNGVIGIFGAIIYVILGLIVFSYCYGIGTFLQYINMIDFLPTIIMVFSVVMMFITSIYKVKGILFGFKDYELIMSLPVKNSHIVISRLFLLYIYNMVFSVIISIPGMIAYGYLGRPNVEFYIINTILIFIIPLVPIVLSSFVGLIIAILSEKFKYSNFVSMIISIGFVSFFIFGASSIGNSSEKVMEMANSIINNIYNIYPLARFYNLGVVEGSIVNFLLFIISSIGVFLLFTYILGRNFKKVNTLMLSKYTKGNYRLKKSGTRSQLGALYQKEIKRYFSSSIYVLNTAIGVVLMTIACISLIFIKPEELLTLLEMPGMVDYMSLVAPFGIAICIGMAYTSICSISLEGNNLWILKISPLDTKTIFDSKILVNLTVTVPALIIDGIIISISLGFNLRNIIIQMLLPIACTLFCSVVGVIINLKFPKLDWKSEVVVVKQSLSAILGLFVGLIPILIIFLAYILGNKIHLSYGLEIGIIIVFTLTFIAYKYLNIKGSKIFYNLTE